MAVAAAPVEAVAAVAAVAATPLPTPLPSLSRQDRRVDDGAVEDASGGGQLGGGGALNAPAARRG